MEKKQKYMIEIIIAIFMIISGAITLILPMVGISNVKEVVCFVFGFIALIYFGGFIKCFKDKDMESIATFLISLIACILYLALENKPINLALILLLFVGVVSLIRLKKADFYNDRRNKVWKVQIITLGLFILTGILTAVNLFYQSEVQLLMFGYFFLINGILELIDPLILYLKR